jgi:2-deoxy-D-gluconate 3-dehydrogenase
MAQRFVEDDAFTQNVINKVPAKRWGQPDDFKGVTCFLASHASDYISGAHIFIDGGVHCT